MKFLVGNIHPDRVADLLQRILEDPYPAAVHFAPRGDRRNVLADAISAELPSMIAALQRIIFKPSLRQSHPTMGAIVPQCKRLHFGVSAKYNSFTEHFLRNQLSLFQERAVKSHIPEIFQKK